MTGTFTEKYVIDDCTKLCHFLGLPDQTYFSSIIKNTKFYIADDKYFAAEVLAFKFFDIGVEITLIYRNNRIRVNFIKPRLSIF